MTIAPAEQIVHGNVLADPLVAFVARCQARALLYASGSISLHAAVDALQAAAEQSELVDQIGQDNVQAIMASAFAVVRADELGASND